MFILVFSNTKYLEKERILIDRFAQQLKKGTLEMVVLALVAEKASYGYELLGRLAQRGGEEFRLKEGTLYPVLYRLEDDGLIQAEWQAGEGRAAPKKYYAVTKEGRERLVEWRAFWVVFCGSVDGLMASAQTAKKEDVV